MNQDKSSLIGFLLIGLILILFNTFFFTENSENNIQTDENKITLPEKKNVILPINDQKNNQRSNKENIIIDSTNIFQNHLFGKENEFSIENQDLKLVISNKGGKITSAFLKDYQDYNKNPLNLFVKDSNEFNIQILTEKELLNTKDLYFKVVQQNNDQIILRSTSINNQYIEFIYTIYNNYMIDFDVNLVKINQIIPSNTNYIRLEWEMQTPQTEKSKSNQDMYTGIQYQYASDKEVDYLSYTKTDEEKIKSKLSWVAFQQQFFSAIILSETGLGKPTKLISTKNEKSQYIKNLKAEFELDYSHKDLENLKFKFYLGPNHYKILQSYNYGFEELIPLGWGIFGWVNKYIIINIFDLLSRYIANYGLIILLLTLIIKICLAPFTYKAFLSQAKMKVLKPEIDALTAKYKEKDPLKSQQETMNLYRKAGVNPMGGCLPMLFQFPILLAMFKFFPASIELRQESFLWADDLSSYDSIMDLPFEIPFYGDHVSLFTLLMTISTLLYTRMNSSMATGQMAQMKWMMYLMPVMFLGFFNNYAAGLSYYYFLANMFTFGQQYVMKQFIDEKKLLKELEANKKKPKKKSKFQKKLEELQKKQEMQMRNRKK